MNRPHFRRRGRAWRLRPADPELLSRLDRLDGLGTRYDAEWPDVLAAEAPPKWVDLFGIDPDFPGGDLAAMAAPLPGMATHTAGTYIFTDVTLTPPAPGMARDALGTYAEYDDMGEWTTPAPYVPAEIPNHAWTVRDVRAAMAAYDLGLGPVRRSDPPLYVACLVDAGTP